MAGSDQAAHWHVYGKHYWFPHGNAAWSLIRLGRWERSRRPSCPARPSPRGLVRSSCKNMSAVPRRSQRTLRRRPNVILKQGFRQEPKDRRPPVPGSHPLGGCHGRLVRGTVCQQPGNSIEKGLDLIEKGEDWFYRVPLHVDGYQRSWPTSPWTVMSLSAGARAAGVLLWRLCKRRWTDQSAADFPAQLAQAEAEFTRAEGTPSPSAWEKASDFVASPGPALRCCLLPVPPG